MIQIGTHLFQQMHKIMKKKSQDPGQCQRQYSSAMSEIQQGAIENEQMQVQVQEKEQELEQEKEHGAIAHAQGGIEQDLAEAT
jgi:hypothetical protein